MNDAKWQDWRPTPCLVQRSEPGMTVLVKDESTGPTRTFKDRLGWELAQRLFAEGAGPETVVSSITLGNTSFAIESALESVYLGHPRPRVVGLVPDGLSERTLGPDTKGRRWTGADVVKAMSQAGIACIDFDTGTEFLTEDLMHELLGSNGISYERFVDVTDGIPEPCYQPIIEEAWQQSKGAGFDIDTILVPVGAGVLFEAAVTWVLAKFPRVRVFGTAVTEVASLGDKIWAYYSPYYQDLIKWGTAKSSNDPGHQVLRVDDAEIMTAIGSVGATMEAEPSAAASFALLQRQQVLENASVVLVVNTGNGGIWASAGSTVLGKD